MKYLCDTYNNIPSTLWPKDINKRAKVDQFLEFHSFQIRPALYKPLRLRMGQKLMGLKIPQNALDYHNKMLFQALELLEKYLLLSKYQYFTGNELTIADLQLYYEVTNLVMLNITLEEYPHLDRWFKLISNIEEVKVIQS